VPRRVAVVRPEIVFGSVLNRSRGPPVLLHEANERTRRS
jgi:hypothetical protein